MAVFWAVAHVIWYKCIDVSKVVAATVIRTKQQRTQRSSYSPLWEHEIVQFSSELFFTFQNVVYHSEDRKKTHFKYSENKNIHPDRPYWRWTMLINVCSLNVGSFLRRYVQCWKFDCKRNKNSQAKLSSRIREMAWKV